MTEQEIADRIALELRPVTVGDVLAFNIDGIRDSEYLVVDDTETGFGLKVLKFPRMPSAVGVRTSISKQWLQYDPTRWRRLT